jgi:hypothetical protein
MAETDVSKTGYRCNYGPEYDAIYLQWMMAYGQATGDPYWVKLAEVNAASAARQASGAGELWLSSWWGGRIADPETHPGMFRTMAATTSLFAWLALYSGQGAPATGESVPARVPAFHKGHHSHGKRRHRPAHSHRSAGRHHSHGRRSR